MSTMIAKSIRAAMIAALLGGGIWSALAQQPPRAPAAPAPAAPAPAAPAPAPAAPAAPAPAPAAPAAASLAASHLAAARGLVLQLKLDEPLRVVLDEMQIQIMASFTTTRPELTNDLKQAMTALNQEVVAKREEMFSTGVRIFAQRFTEPELLELTKFLKTPLGEKYIQMQPEAFGEYLREVQEWVPQLNDFVISRLRAEMAKKGHKL